MTNLHKLLAGGACLALVVPAAGFAATSHHATIVEKEFKLVPKKTIVAHGKVTLTLRNTGKFKHALSIEHGGANHKDVKSKTVQPGKTVKFTVTIKAGHYEIYCPIDGHKSKGMEGTLIVR